NRKTKFGIRSGRTLRRYPTKKYCGFSYNGLQKSGHEFAVVKVLYEQADIPSNDNVDKIFEFDDGIPYSSREPYRRSQGYPHYPVIHSLNKHK
ncbi:hypothetical protein, partial [Salmonella sp. s54925]|uniref:hypothetical protein n=1 Tax=Salmonella sp. s54925 TaxID=3159674 RepID=UPI00397FA298